MSASPVSRPILKALPAELNSLESALYQWEAQPIMKRKRFREIITEKKMRLGLVYGVHLRAKALIRDGRTLSRWSRKLAQRSRVAIKAQQLYVRRLRRHNEGLQQELLELTLEGQLYEDSLKTANSKIHRLETRIRILKARCSEEEEAQDVDEEDQPEHEQPVPEQPEQENQDHVVLRQSQVPEAQEEQVVVTTGNPQNIAQALEVLLQNDFEPSQIAVNAVTSTPKHNDQDAQLNSHMEEEEGQGCDFVSTEKVDDDEDVQQMEEGQGSHWMSEAPAMDEDF